MCLIALAHLASARYPLVIAANRDEDHERPTHAADWWDGDDVVGGRDVLHGGAWLAMSRCGRFAAVTNLRGTVKAPQARSRGALVREFVMSSVAPHAYVEAIDASEYAGFHLFTGEIGGTLAYLSRTPTLLDPGIHGVSNAPAGEHWPKVDAAIDAVRDALQLRDADAVVDELLRFLAASRERGRVEEEVFIAGDRYGTRASTVIVATADSNEIVFVEQGWAPRGMKLGERSVFRFSRDASADAR